MRTHRKADNGEPPPTTIFAITPEAIRNLDGFLRATGWTCIYGLNLGFGSAEADIPEAQFVAQDVYREHYLTFADAYRRNLSGARSRGEIAAGPDGSDEPRAWALIGMSVFLGMRYGIWNEDLSPGEVADIAIGLVSEGLRKREP